MAAVDPSPHPSRGAISSTDPRPIALSHVTRIAYLGQSAACDHPAACRVCCKNGTLWPARPLGDFSRIRAFAVEATICDSCYESCLETYQTAISLIETGWQQAEGDHILLNRLIGPKLIACRVALLRALPIIKVDGACPAWFSTPCPWCSCLTGGAEGCVLMEVDGGCRSTTHWFPRHKKCWAEVNETVHSTHLAFCMASCAFMLCGATSGSGGLLPEIVRQVASFVCRLTAVGLEEAAARRCPVFEATR